MAAHDRVFGSSLPSTSDKIGSLVVEEGIDDFKDDFSQRLVLDHQMGGELSGVDGDQEGRHKQVMMKESSSAPTEKEDSGVLYTLDKDDGSELYYKDSEGTATYLTSSGELILSEVLKEYKDIYSEFVTIEGTCSTASSPYSIVDLNIEYPSGFDKDNSCVVASKIKDLNIASTGNPPSSWYGDSTFYEQINMWGTLWDGETPLTYSIKGVHGVKVFFTDSYIVLRTGYMCDAQPYFLILGKLI